MAFRWNGNFYARLSFDEEEYEEIHFLQLIQFDLLVFVAAAAAAAVLCGCTDFDAIFYPYASMPDPSSPMPFRLLYLVRVIYHRR